MQPLIVAVNNCRIPVSRGRFNLDGDTRLRSAEYETVTTLLRAVVDSSATLKTRIAPVVRLLEEYWEMDIDLEWCEACDETKTSKLTFKTGFNLRNTSHFNLFLSNLFEIADLCAILNRKKYLFQCAEI